MRFGVFIEEDFEAFDKFRLICHIRKAAKFPILRLRACRNPRKRLPLVYSAERAEWLCVVRKTTKNAEQISGKFLRLGHFDRLTVHQQPNTPARCLGRLFTRQVDQSVVVIERGQTSQMPTQNTR